MNLVIPSFDLVKRQVLPNKSYSHLLFKGKFFFLNLTKMLKLAKINVSSFLACRNKCFNPVSLLFSQLMHFF